MHHNKKRKIESILFPDWTYTKQNNAYCFLPGDRIPKNTAGTGLLGKIQERLKRYGVLYYTLVNIFGPLLRSHNFNQHFKSLLKIYDKNTTILNLGSGPHYPYKREDIINVDLYAFNEVDIVSDASSLPIKSDSVDLILNIAMLEHVEDPEKMTREMHRVLKKDGHLLSYIPFIAPFHAAPYDFHRWTVEGVKKHFSYFEHTVIGIGAGPTSGMLWVVQEWLSILFSFGNRTLHDIILLLLMIATFPIKLLDIFLVHFANAEKIASCFFVIGKK